MRAAQSIVESLKAHGVERVYCVPGESYLDLLDALRDSAIQVIVCRHEGGASFMAGAEAKLTGKTSVILVSRGPGATNAAIGIHMANQDALPVILMIGQVGRKENMRGVFQEMDYGQVFGSFTKGVFEVTDGHRLHEIMPRAFHLSQSGTPGPVVVSLPEDMQSDEVENLAPLVYPQIQLTHAATSISRIQSLIDSAERPLIVAGAYFRSAEGAIALQRLAGAQRIPVAVTWKNQDIFDNTSPLYAGHLGFGSPKPMKDLLKKSDLIIAIGTRLGDVASLSYELPTAPQPAQPLIHIYPDTTPLGKVFRTDFPLVANPVAIANDLATKARVVSSAREAWISQINQYTRSNAKIEVRETSDGVDFAAVVEALIKHAPADTIITTDAGNTSTWVHRHWPMTPRNTLIGGIVGAMGLGVPAAIAASLIEPHRLALCFVGDGGVLMTGQEIATAMAFSAKPKIIIADNNTYGTIRLHQEREFPGRISGTDLVNPDFGKWAESFGALAFQINNREHVNEMIQSFLTTTELAVLHVKTSKQTLSANSFLPNLS